MCMLLRAPYSLGLCLVCRLPSLIPSRYWLYAAVSMRCLLVSNDEMRDHVFATLGNDFFFPKWKERHQVSRWSKAGRWIFNESFSHTGVGGWHLQYSVASFDFFSIIVSLWMVSQT